VILEVVVGDGDISGALDDIHKPIRAVGEVAMVHPDVVRAEHINGVPVRLPSTAIMAGRASDVRRTCDLAVMNVQVVDDDVADELQRETGASGDVHVVAATVERLEAVHDELLLQLDVHVAAEDDPKRLLLNDAVAERAGLGVDHVVVAVVGHHVNLPVSTSDSVLAEAQRAIR